MAFEGAGWARGGGGWGGCGGREERCAAWDPRWVRLRVGQARALAVDRRPGARGRARCPGLERAAASRGKVTREGRGTQGKCLGILGERVG